MTTRLHRLKNSLFPGLASALMGLGLSCARLEREPELVARGDIYYTQVNIRFANANKIPSTNYLRGELLPVGSRVRVYERNERRIRFADAGGRHYELVYVRKHTHVAPSAWFQRHFAKEDPWQPGGIFDRMDPEIAAAIEEGKLLGGMSREAVLMAYGYPPAHRTPSLKDGPWTYWTARGQTTLAFRHDRLDSVDGKPLPQTVRLFVVSDPPGASVEAEGRFAGRTPCVLSLSLDPQRPEQNYTFRAVPMPMDTPRFGVLASAPVGGVAAGETIVVRNVLPLSAAHKMGLRAGDRLISINGALVRSEQECGELVAAAGFGAALKVVVERNGKEMTLDGLLEMPQQGAFYAAEKKYSVAQLMNMRDQVMFFDLKRQPTANGVAGGAPVKLSETDPENDPPAPPPVAPDQPLKILATGFALAKGGYVLTAASALGERTAVVVRTADGKATPAVVMRRDEGNDWALLHAPGLDAAGISLGRPDALRSGAPIRCVGFAMDPTSGLAASEPELRAGNVLEISGLSGDSRYMQLALPIGGGYSGSPVLDETGAWVGLVSDKLDGIIHAVAPPGSALPATKFVLKASLVEPLLPSAVRENLERAAATAKPEPAERTLKSVAAAVVMILAREEPR